MLLCRVTPEPLPALGAQSKAPARQGELGDHTPPGWGLRDTRGALCPTDTHLCPTGLCLEAPVPAVRVLSTEGPSLPWGSGRCPQPRARRTGEQRRQGSPGPALPRASSSWAGAAALARALRPPCPCPQSPSSGPTSPGCCPQRLSSCADPPPRPGAALPARPRCSPRAWRGPGRPGGQHVTRFCRVSSCFS